MNALPWCGTDADSLHQTHWRTLRFHRTSIVDVALRARRPHGQQAPVRSSLGKQSCKRIHRRDELAPSIAVRTDVKDSGARRWGTRTLPMMESCPLTEQIATSLA